MQFRQNIYHYKEKKIVGLPIDILQNLIFGTLGEREIFMHLLHKGVTDVSKAELIETIAEAIGKHQVNIGKDLKLLHRNTLVEKTLEVDRKLRYYIPKEVAFTLGKTALPESVDVFYPVEIKPITTPIVSNSDTGEPVDKEEIKRPGGEIKRLAGAIYDHYMKVFNKDPRYKLTPDRLAAIRARLDEGFTMVECKEHIDFIAASPFHNGDNKEGKIHTDLKDIIFNKTKFHKRIDEITQNRPKVIKKVKDEKAEEALMAERYRKEEEEYFKRKKLNAEV